jgi:TPR repeat protein
MRRTLKWMAYLTLAACAAPAQTGIRSSSGDGHARDEHGNDLEALCLAGQPAQCVTAGEQRETGRRATLDPTRALVLYEQGCAPTGTSNGLPAACGKWGAMLRRGSGGPRDAQKAVDLLKPACQGGYQPACVEWGTHYLETTPRNLDLSKRLFTMACDRKEPLGCVRLAELQIPQPDEQPRALELLRTACQAGSQEGCVALGQAHERGQGLPRDPLLAIQLYRAACAAPAAVGCFALANCYQQGIGIAADVDKALELYETGCGLGHVMSCTFAALVRDQAADPSGARSAREMACALGSGAACAQLADQCEATPSDHCGAERVLTWHLRACSEGRHLACVKAGQAYERGNGVPADTERAKALYRRACQAGDGFACQLLKE